VLPATGCFAHGGEAIALRQRLGRGAQCLSRNIRGMPARKEQVYFCALSRDAQKLFWHKGVWRNGKGGSAKKHRLEETGLAGYMSRFHNSECGSYFCGGRGSKKCWLTRYRGNEPLPATALLDGWPPGDYHFEMQFELRERALNLLNHGNINH
jgi:hypothetical protein